MNTALTISTTTLVDLDFIYTLFDSAIAYQRLKGYPVWKDFDKGALISDISQNNQYKVLANDQIAMVFSVCYSDPLIWGERENGTAIYLHRIVVNPSFKGQKLFSRVLGWAIDHCRERRLPLIRMDTWFDNNVIIEYYKSFGFSLMGSCTTPDSPALASQNRNLKVALLEYKIEL